MTELVKKIQQEEEMAEKRLQKAEMMAEQIRRDADIRAEELLEQAEIIAEKYRKDKIAELESQAEAEDARSTTKAETLCRAIRKSSDGRMEQAVAYILTEICGIG